MSRISKDQCFMMMAKVAALRSTCNSRPTGAVLVKEGRIISTGYNGAMSGVSHCTDKGPGFCFRRESGAPENDKYNWCKSVHAEANAIAQAAKFGISVEGAVCYCTLAPCYVCLKLMASSGIVGVYYELEYESDQPERDELWMSVIHKSPMKFMEKLTVDSPCFINFTLPTSLRSL
jgi:dCMP deaminase